MIFNALSGSSSQVPVTPIGGNRMYYALWALPLYYIDIHPPLRRDNYIGGGGYFEQFNEFLEGPFWQFN